MKVTALQSFVDETGTHEPGDVLEMADWVAVIRIDAGLCKAVKSTEREAAVIDKGPERAVMPAPAPQKPKAAAKPAAKRGQKR